ncbi:sulfurtransferase complex subunit TusD [Pseudomaricurvus sp.]|uniref:sulfurtransferase complex subunit TusD n=1 Tax=Pseudomaricurvus sp. TaxID=2004510 RepID=UPI003F6ACC71
MKFSLIVYNSPAEQSPFHTAIDFAQTLIHQGHELYRVFFYGDGVYHAANDSSTLLKTDDCESVSQKSVSQRWSALAQEHGLDLVVCVTAALERKIASEVKVESASKDGSRLTQTDIIGIREGFQLSGLGQLVDAIASSDRTITFR